MSRQGREHLLALCEGRRQVILEAWVQGIRALPMFAQVPIQDIQRNVEACLTAYVDRLSGRGDGALIAFAQRLADLRFRAGFEIHAPLSAAAKFFDGVAAALADSPLDGAAQGAVWGAVVGEMDAFSAHFCRFFTQRMLEASENRFRELAEEATDVVLVVDDGGTILDANRALETLLECPRSGWIGRPWTDLVVDDGAEGDRAAAALRGVFAGAAPRDLPLRVCSSDGRVHHMRLSGHISLARHECRGVLTLRDVTAEQIRRAQLVQTEKLASLGQLAASMTHELNNPLTWIMGNVQQALDEASVLQGPRTELLVEMLEDALRGARRMADIIRDLRGFVAGNRRQWMTYRVDEMLDLSLRIAGVQIRARARVEQEIGEIPPAVGHPGRLSQVFINLLLNAAEALDPARDVRACRLWLRARCVDDGAAYEVEVQDNGRGIPEHVQRRLFEPFVSSGKQDDAVGGGMGLGLWVCQDIVREHGGEISVRTGDQGTCFTVRLPLRPPRSVPEPSAPRSGPVPAAAGGHVLLVDDEPMVRRLLARQLAATFQVTTAESGEAAIDALRACGGRVDAVVCDVGLPGIDGFEVLAQIRAQWPALAGRVALMSGVHSFGDEQGRVPCLSKPFPRAELEAVVRALVHGDPDAPA